MALPAVGGTATTAKACATRYGGHRQNPGPEGQCPGFSASEREFQNFVGFDFLIRRAKMYQKNVVESLEYKCLASLDSFRSHDIYEVYGVQGPQILPSCIARLSCCRGIHPF